MILLIRLTFTVCLVLQKLTMLVRNLQVLDYLGAELRGTYGVSKTNKNKNKFKQVGAYLKPNYDISAVDGLNLYGLLGASKTNIGAGDTAFSYGAGLDYKLADKISIFSDLVQYLKKSNVNSSQWGLSVGAAYQF